MSGNKKPYGTVLIKASNILDTLASASDPIPMKEISDLSGITLSTTSKILNTLEHIGYVKRTSERKYSLGGRLIHLASTSFMQFDIVRESYPALKRLNQQFEETVHLGTLQDNQVLYINKLSAKGNGKEMISRIGHTQDLYCSSMGKAMLASFDDTERSKYIKNTELIPSTKHTITSEKELVEQLDEIERAGYSVDDRESENHVYCVGAFINSNQTTSKKSNDAYAFSISVPYEKITKELQERMISAVIKTKNIIEFQLETTNR